MLQDYDTAASNLSVVLPWQVQKLMNGNESHYHLEQVKGGKFIRYTLPANELRVTLALVRRLGESFVLEYTQIRENNGVAPGDGGQLDEAWRTNGCGRAVTLHEKAPNGGSSQRTMTCHVQDS